MSFINLSNHPSQTWGKEQTAAALRYGKIVDYPFPDVNPYASAEDVEALAEQVTGEIMKLSPVAVMCQGEFSLTYALVRMFRERGICVLSACSERHVLEDTMPDGKNLRTSIFEFVQFREYR